MWPEGRRQGHGLLVVVAEYYCDGGDIDVLYLNKVNKKSVMFNSASRNYANYHEVSIDNYF